MAIHIGHVRAGWPGLLVAGICFILPAVLIVSVLAWTYVRFGSLPHMEGLLSGVKPVIIAVIGQALWSLSRSAIKSKTLAVIGLLAVIASFLGVSEILVILLGGLASLVISRTKKPYSKNNPRCLFIHGLFFFKCSLRNYCGHGFHRRSIFQSFHFILLFSESRIRLIWKWLRLTFFCDRISLKNFIGFLRPNFWTPLPLGSLPLGLFLLRLHSLVIFYQDPLGLDLPLWEYFYRHLFSLR